MRWYQLSTELLAVPQQTGKLLDDPRGLDDLLCSTAMAEIAILLPFGRAAARTMHPADPMPADSWRSAREPSSLLISPRT
jgi:hypothetical protein